VSENLIQIEALVDELENELSYAEGDLAEMDAKYKGQWPGSTSVVAEVVDNLRKKHLNVTLNTGLTELPKYTRDDARNLCDKLMQSMSEDHATYFKERMVDWETDDRFTPVKSMMIVVRSRWNDADTSILDEITTLLFYIPLERVPEYINHNVYGFYAKWRLEIGK
jgi:hypothetical protein